MTGLALVLTGGGARAAYQVGVLQAVADRLPGAQFTIVTGVSAGAINAAYLAGHPGTFATAARDLGAHWGRLTSERVYGKGTAWLRALLTGFRSGADAADARAVFDARTLREFLGESIRFDGIGSNLEAGRLRALALSATSYATGDSVTFVHGLPDIPMWSRAHRRAERARLTLDHVMASAAIPIVFPAVRLNGGYFGDGSVRQTFPLSPAIHLGADRILAIATRPATGAGHPPADASGGPSTARAMGLLLHSVFMDHLDADGEMLEAFNGMIPPREGGAPPAEVRPVRFVMVRPSRDLGALAEEWSHRLPRPLRILLGRMGGPRRGGADFLSYLLFDPDFTRTLIEWGAADARSQWPAIEDLLASTDAGTAQAG